MHKLYRDLLEGEKIKIGDRWCGGDFEWFVMDEHALKLHEDVEGLEIKTESFPFQREVFAQDA